MPDYSYAHEKLRATVSSLAEAEGTLRERLLNAYSSQGFRLLAIDGGKRYPDLHERIKALHDRLTAAPTPGGIGTIEATVAQLSDDDVREVVSEILELEAVVTALYWTGRAVY